MAKRTYRVTFDDGTVETRTTESKHYTHAVAVAGEGRAPYVIRWSETREAAAKFAGSRWPRSLGAYVVPVDGGGPVAPRITAIGLDPAGPTAAEVDHHGRTEVEHHRANVEAELEAEAWAASLPHEPYEAALDVNYQDSEELPPHLR